MFKLGRYAGGGTTNVAAVEDLVGSKFCSSQCLNVARGSVIGGIMKLSTAQTGEAGVGVAQTKFSKAGFVFRSQREADYGIDAIVEVMDGHQASGRLIAVQIKSGPSYSDNRTVYVEPDTAEYWLDHCLPVIVCIVDVKNEIAYWEHANADTLVEKEKSFAITAPVEQVVDAHARPQLVELATPVVPTSEYTVLQDDVSHAGAKRYSLRIILNRNFGRTDMVAAARQAIEKYKHVTYNRSPIAEGRWQDSPAQVVTCFVHLSAIDEARSHNFCRLQWIDPDLDPRFRPAEFSGERIGDGLIVDWNSNYEMLSKLYDENELSKGEYLALADRTVASATNAYTAFREQFARYEAGSIDETQMLARGRSHLEQIRSAHDELFNVGVAPFECRELERQLHLVFGYMWNLWLIYSSLGWVEGEESRRRIAARQYIEFVTEHVPGLRYEREKVR